MAWMAIAAMALQAVGTLQAGSDAQAAAEANAAMSRREAEMSRQRATLERQQAASAAETEGREANRRRGRNIAAAAGSGVSRSGSVLDVLADQALEDELQQANTLFTGEIKGREADEAATVADAEAAQSIARGKAAKRASIMKAATGVAFSASKMGASS